jgi:2,4-dienoyl-CoA reductase-like NADH-dependent reductase (Old Yellow Enzyme family)
MADIDESKTNGGRLFTPGKLGPITLRNRAIRSAAFENMATNNSPSEMLFNYHKSVAEGGAGMTTVAYASVTQSGLSFKNQLWLRPEIIPGLRKMTDAIHAAGAAASIQIGHCGNMSHRNLTKCTPLSASSGFNMYAYTLYRGLKEHEMIEMAKSYGTAVKLAREAGFDCVEVHAGHGYLISQFLSKYTNRRKDQYGGPLSNRMKFMDMCINEALEASEGKCAVIAKTNMRDGFKGGNDIEEGLEIAKELKRIGIQGMVLSGGFVSKAPMYVMRGTLPMKSMTYYMHPLWVKFFAKIFGPMIVPPVPFQEAYFLEDALRFRKEISNVPLIYVGGLVCRKKIEEVLGDGFEFVQMARAFVTQPDFVNKMKEGEESCDCGHSNYCIARMYSLEMACHKHLTEKLPKSLENEIARLENK